MGKVSGRGGREPVAVDVTRAGHSAKERAYRHTKAAILDGSLPGGDLISEGQVAEVLAMSRTPVREAFLRLEAEGLLRLFPKRGALVVPVSPAEVEAVLEARELVEGHAVAKLCAAGEAERAAVVARLRDVLAEQRDAFAAGNEQAFAEGDRSFHTVLVESAGNPILSELYASLRDRQLRMNLGSLLGHGPGRAEEILGQHEAILAALGPDRTTEAHGRLAEHLEATRTAVLGR